MRLILAHVLYRKKMGFSVPLANWLRNELFELADDVFGKKESGLAQCFDMNKVRELWLNHQRGQDQHTQELWSMIAFELWWRTYENE